MTGPGGDELPQVLIDRRRKLEELRAAGIEPFPHTFSGVEPIAAVKAPHEGLPAGEETQARARIAQLEDKLRSAQVIDASELDNAQVRVGSLVAVKDEKGKSFQYTIVGSTEADPSAHRLSNESPVGKALIGRKKGDAVSVPTPKGERKLTISKISVA